MKKPGKLFANLKKWKSKWFVLTYTINEGLKIHIYSSHNDAANKNSKQKCIILDKTTKVTQSFTYNHSFVFNITISNNVVLTVAASSNEEMVSWRKSIEIFIDKFNNPNKTFTPKNDSNSVSSTRSSITGAKKVIEEWNVELVPSSIKTNENLEGKFIMSVDNKNITLKNTGTKLVEKIWSLSLVVCCARSKTRFTFEVLNKQTNEYDLISMNEILKCTNTTIYSFLCSESITIYNLIEKFRPKSAASSMSKLTSRSSFAGSTQFVIKNVTNVTGRPTVLSEKQSILFNENPSICKEDEQITADAGMSFDCRVSVRVCPIFEYVEKVNNLKFIPPIYRNFASFTSFDYHQRTITKTTNNVRISRSKTFETNRIPMNVQ